MTVDTRRDPRNRNKRDGPAADEKTQPKCSPVTRAEPATELRLRQKRRPASSVAGGGEKSAFLIAFRRRAPDVAFSLARPSPRPKVRRQRTAAARSGNKDPNRKRSGHQCTRGRPAGHDSFSEARRSVQLFPKPGKDTGVSVVIIRVTRRSRVPAAERKRGLLKASGKAFSPNRSDWPAGGSRPVSCA